MRFDCRPPFIRRIGFNRSGSRAYLSLAILFQDKSGILVRLIADKICRAFANPINFRSSSW